MKTHHLQFVSSYRISLQRAATTGWILLIVMFSGCVSSLNVPVNIQTTETLPKEIAIDYLNKTGFNFGSSKCCNFSEEGVRRPGTLGGSVYKPYSEVRYWVQHWGSGGLMLYLPIGQANAIFVVKGAGNAPEKELVRVVTALESLGVRRIDQ